MARRYEDHTDERLAEKITKFTEALEDLACGGDVARIQTDGRLMEIVAGNTEGAERILQLLLDEKETRANGGVLPGRAIGMRFYNR